MVAVVIGRVLVQRWFPEKIDSFDRIGFYIVAVPGAFIVLWYICCDIGAIFKILFSRKGAKKEECKRPENQEVGKGVRNKRQQLKPHDE